MPNRKLYCWSGEISGRQYYFVVFAPSKIWIARRLNKTVARLYHLYEMPDTAEGVDVVLLNPDTIYCEPCGDYSVGYTPVEDENKIR